MSLSWLIDLAPGLARPHIRGVMSYREVTTGRTFPVLRDALDAQKWGRIPREAILEQDGHTNTALRAGRVLTMGRKKRL